jgi:hypothetical protein
MAKKAKQKAKPRPPKPKARRAGQTGRPSLGTVDWTEAFLQGIQAGLHVLDAATMAKVNVATPYRRRDEDEAFRLAWEQADRIGTQALEAEAGRRAYHGTLKPVYYMGKECGQIREYSDTLLMFLLRARRPKKYRDNAKFEHVGRDGAALPRVMIYLPDNGRSKPDDASDNGSQAEEAAGTSSP